jgi:hypothetical protein
MLNFHDQPHAGKPADVTFMHFPTGAEHIRIIFNNLICHCTLSSKKRLIYQKSPPAQNQRA